MKPLMDPKNVNEFFNFITRDNVCVYEFRVVIEEERCRSRSQRRRKVKKNRTSTDEWFEVPPEAGWKQSAKLRQKLLLASNPF